MAKSSVCVILFIVRVCENRKRLKRTAAAFSRCMRPRLAMRKLEGRFHEEPLEGPTSADQHRKRRYKRLAKMTAKKQRVAAEECKAA